MSQQFVKFVFISLSCYPTVIFPTVIFCCCIRGSMPIYLSFLLSKRNTNRVTIIPFFLKFSISSVIKTYFLRVRALVFIRSGDPFTAHDRNQRVVVSWERSVIRISYPCSGGVFSLKIAFTRFNSGYIFLPLLYFFLVLIV